MLKIKHRLDGDFDVANADWQNDYYHFSLWNTNRTPKVCQDFADFGGNNCIDFQYEILIIIIMIKNKKILNKNIVACLSDSIVILPKKCLD